ncbi:PSP1 domain-containing protein [Lewinella cohaerens]|uniref:PSP1 domain-containing protein n=1 Tax=Lewinella cohaerens TaxID=70995 RepID=UPI00037D7FCB|nr:regulatory iron-sulfur-containing complex subunit RicT [Lewinella cohaerens]
MGCTGCSVGIENGTPSGCGSKGNCDTGGCNRMNTFDWLTQMDISDVDQFGTVEVSFKNGSRKSFFHLPSHLHLHTGDMVVVEAKNGYDIGRISLSGELVRLQMKKKKVKEDSVIPAVIRQANERDLERLEEARRQEKPSLIQARAISRSLGLDMKIGDVEFQGDKRKATFFYTANGRVDFRELIRHFAREFRVKIEMRQIGARQESARIGGLGSCGRELCCSTWLTDFKSVSTAAARYQNLAINQAKLSGQCGRLKCCLNYELDTYMEAVQAFPKKADKLQTESGAAVLVKTDIFKQLMFYAYTEGRNRGKLYALKIEQVAEIQALNKKGEKPIDLGLLAMAAIDEEDQEPDYEDVTGFIELPPEQRKKKSRNKRRKSSNRGNKPDERSRREDSKKKPDERPRKDRPKKKEEGPKKEKPQAKGEEKPGSNQKRRRNNRRRSKNRKPDSRNNNNQQGNNPTKDN